MFKIIFDLQLALVQELCPAAERSRIRSGHLWREPATRLMLPRESPKSRAS